MGPVVVVAEAISRAAVDLLSASCDVVEADGETRRGLFTRLADAAGLIVRSATSVDDGLLDAAPRLRVVGRAGVGVDNIDLASASARGVLVVNAPKSNTISAAEHTFALLLGLARHLPRADQQLRSGLWNRKEFQGVEVYGKTLGVVGLGKIGTLVAARAAVFGMRVLAHDPYISDDAAAAAAGVELVGFDTLLAQSEFITFHLPKNEETTGLFDAEVLARCRRGVRLVNTARGGIVDEAALASAIRSGHVAGAAIDVFDTEPATDNPLFDLPQVVVTPHLAASTGEAQHRAGIQIAESVIAALNGNPVCSAVNGHTNRPDAGSAALSETARSASPGGSHET